MTPMLNEIGQYFGAADQMAHNSDYLLWLFIGWTLGKILFYIFPILDLLSVYYSEQNADQGHMHWRERSRRITIWLLVLPLVDVVVYFYIVLSILGDLRGIKETLKLRSQMYGIGAGILNVILMSELYDSISFSSGFFGAESMGIQLIYAVAIFACWAVLAYYHLLTLFMIRHELIFTARLLGEPERALDRVDFAFTRDIVQRMQASSEIDESLHAPADDAWEDEEILPQQHRARRRRSRL